MQNVCHEVGQSQQTVCSTPERPSLDRRFLSRLTPADHPPERIWRTTKPASPWCGSQLMASMPGSQHSVGIKRCRSESAPATAIDEAVCCAKFFSPKPRRVVRPEHEAAANCLSIDGLVGRMQSVA